MALVLTLMVITLITAMVTEFAYGVYSGNNSLNNWYELQRLSVLAGSGIDIAKEFIADEIAKGKYTYPGSFDMNHKSSTEGFDAELDLRIMDENSKFNINTIVYPNGAINEKAYNGLKRLLSHLSIDVDLADYIADWIDPDTEERLRESERDVKNTWLYTLDELMLIKGMDKSSYERLLPYVTIYGNSLININSAEKPVLISLSDDMTDELAQRIIDYRKTTPFEEISNLQKIAGFDLSVYGPISASITVKGRYFYVKSSASSGGIRSIIEAVIGTGRDIKFWREF